MKTLSDKINKEDCFYLKDVREFIKEWIDYKQSEINGLRNLISNCKRTSSNCKACEREEGEIRLLLYEIERFKQKAGDKLI